MLELLMVVNGGAALFEESVKHCSMLAQLRRRKVNDPPVFRGHEKRGTICESRGIAAHAPRLHVDQGLTSHDSGAN